MPRAARGSISRDVPGACAARPGCAGCCARRASRRTTSSTRCSSAPGRAPRNGSLPGVFHLSVDEAVREAEEVKADGVPAVMLFGLPDKRRRRQRRPTPEGVRAAAMRAIKKAVPELVVVTTCASASTRRTATAGWSSTATSRTTRPSSSWGAPRCRTPPPAPTWSRRPA